MPNSFQEHQLLLLENLWTDESNFTRDYIVNTYNENYWALDNTRIGRQARQQERWCGIWGIQILGPIFYDGTLKLVHRRRLLRDTITWLVWRGFAPRCITGQVSQQIIGYGDLVEGHRVRRTSQPRTSTLGLRQGTSICEWANLSKWSIQHITRACRRVTPAMLQRLQKCCYGFHCALPPMENSEKHLLFVFLIMDHFLIWSDNKLTFIFLFNFNISLFGLHMSPKSPL